MTAINLLKQGLIFKSSANCARILNEGNERVGVMYERENSYISQGDIVYVDFDKGKGSETFKNRPVIVLSNDYIYETCGLSIVAPISSTGRGYPYYHQLKNVTGDVSGQVCLNEARAFDLRARGKTTNDIIGYVSDRELEEILRKFRRIFVSGNGYVTSF